MDPTHGHPQPKALAEAAPGAACDEVPVELETPGFPETPGLGDLHGWATRVERGARDLAEAARALLFAEQERGRTQPAQTGGGNPLRECELASACRAAGLYERAVRHSVRACEILLAAGCQREAREILEEGSVALEYQGPDSLEVLANAWDQLGADARAAEIALAAAERHRSTRRFGRAIALCRRTAELDRAAPGLHRTFGLSLLAAGDAEGALGHLARWRSETPEDLGAMIWYTEALFQLEQEDEGRRALRELARRAGLRRRRSLPIEGLAQRVAHHLRRARSAGNPELESPFWHRPELVGKLAAEEPPGTSEAVAAAEPARERADEIRSARRRPRVFISLDTEFHRVRLSEILSSEGIDVLRCSAVESAEDRLRRELLPIDLLLLSIPRGPRADLRFLRRVRAIPSLGAAPILCVTTLDRSGLDFEQLRRLGVVGLIDKNALPEEIVFRVNSVVWGRNGPVRRFPRAPVFMAVDLEAEGRETSEYASTLACGGMGLVSQRVLEVNTEVKLRFRLPTAPDQLIEAEGKVLYCRPFRRKNEVLHRIGLFFYPLTPDQRRIVEEEVQRILEEAGF